MSIGEQSFEFVSDLPERMENHGFGSYDFRKEGFGPDEAYRLGNALSEVYGDGEIVVARDHRELSNELKNAVSQGLEDGGNEVTYIGKGPTDLVSYLVSIEDFTGGIAVTASHMPTTYHGIKPLNHEGRIFDEIELSQTLDKFEEKDQVPGSYSTTPPSIFETDHNYASGVVSRYDELFDDDLSGISVALDPGNGMAALTLQPVFSKLGIEEEDIYTVNDSIDPLFPGRGSDPTDSDLSDLRTLVREEDVDLGLATDGDADRVVYMNEKGEVLDGDEALGILGKKYLEHGGSKALEKIALSANSSQLVEEHIEPDGVAAYQPVGAVFPAKEALRDDSYVFGGQPNGHYLDPGFTPYDSGTLMAAVMAGIMKEEESSVSQLQDQLPAYDIARIDFETSGKEEAVNQLREMAGIKIDNSFNGIYRTKLKENGLSGIGSHDNLIFRASGTEDVVRLTLESRTNEQVLEDIGGELEQRLED